MAQLIINIPDAVATRVLQGYSEAMQYDRFKLAGETRAQFSKRMVARHIKQKVAEYEAQAAADQATIEARNDAEQNLDVT